jgi:hypothetical protein
VLFLLNLLLLIFPIFSVRHTLLQTSVFLLCSE